MKVKATILFHDLKAKKDRAKGEIFEVDAGRATELKNIGFVEIIEEPENPDTEPAAPEEVPENPKPKRRKTKEQ